MSKCPDNKKLSKQINAHQIKREIDTKLDELFDLFWECTLKEIDAQADQLRLMNCPKLTIHEHIRNKTFLMQKRYKEIEDVLKKEYKNRFINEQWMDSHDTAPTIPTALSIFENDQIDGSMGFFITNRDIEHNQSIYFQRK